MKKDAHLNLSRRERQIMDILFARGSAAGSEIHRAPPDPPSYSALRVSGRLALASAVCVVLRRQPAALRNVVWAAAFGVALLTPLLTPIGFRITRPAVVPLAEGPVSPVPAVTEAASSQPAPPHSSLP